MFNRATPFLVVFFAVSALAARFDRASRGMSQANVIHKDVVIVGGGATGSHAAFRLREDFQKSVALVEKGSILGGHVDTYFDPETGEALEFGVQTYFPYGNSFDFFERLNVTLAPAERSTIPSLYADFTTGAEVSGYTPVDSDAANAAARKYLQLFEENGWEDMIIPGYWNFPPGNEVPEDFLIPIGEFVRKYSIEPLLARMWSITGGGVGSRGDFENLLSLTVMQAFAPPTVRLILGELAGAAPVTNNMELYNNIAAVLGSDVLYNSTVVASTRTDSGVELLVRDRETGDETRIVAKKLLMAIQPTRQNLAPFDLDEHEEELFSKPKYGRSWIAIGTHSKLPRGVSVVNLNASAVDEPIFSFLEPPYTTRFGHYGGDTAAYRIPSGGSDFDAFDQAAAYETASAALERLAGAGTIPPLEGEPLKMLAWSDHGAVGYGVSAGDLRNNWVNDVYALQGKRSTWFTGAGFATDFTTTLWEFNEGLFPMIVEDL